MLLFFLVVSSCLQSAKPFVFSRQIQAQTTHPCPFERKGNESFESVSKKWGKINIALHPLVRTGGDARYIIAILFVVWPSTLPTPQIISFHQYIELCFLCMFKYDSAFRQDYSVRINPQSNAHSGRWNLPILFNSQFEL